MLTKAAEDLFAFTEEEMEAAAARYATPCFVYSLGLARSRWRLLREALPGRVRLAYAVKSNPGAPLLETFAAEGAWFDCASAGEISAVLAAGGTGSGMVVAGPAKTHRDLQAALYAGARVQVDGIEDVQRLHELHTGEAPLRVSVRVHPASGVSESASIIGGAGPSAFGVDEEDLDAFLTEARRYDRVTVTGLQVFSASNELDPGKLLANHRTALRIGQAMHEDHGIDLELVDLGGGLGIRYAPSEPSLDIWALGAGLGRLLEEHPWFTGELLLEPGRWLSGPCGVYLTRVVRVKESRGVRFALLEGGINHLLAAVADRPVLPDHRTRPLGRAHGIHAGRAAVHVAGPARDRRAAGGPAARRRGGVRPDRGICLDPGDVALPLPPRTGPALARLEGARGRAIL